MVSSVAPIVEIASLDEPFSDAVLARLESLLPEFIATRRWFRAKARTIRKAQIEDIVPIGDRSYMLVIQVDYTDGEADEYLLPVVFGARLAALDLIASYRSSEGTDGNISDALWAPEFRNSLLETIAHKRVLRGRNGYFSASATQAFSGDAKLDAATIESSVSRAEQSNTSIVFADRFILKLFRKIEPGINPDIEVGSFLTRRGFRHTPAVLGKIEYRRSNDAIYAAAILQEFVKNRGDAWQYTLDSLRVFFDRALSGNASAPTLASRHPMQLAASENANEIRGLVGEYADSAQLLGRRTAEMHRALADARGDLDFEPLPFTQGDAERLEREMLSQADTTFDLLRRKRSTLPGAVAEHAQVLLDLEQKVREQFSRLRETTASALRIRFHGDYHLGQVLYTGSDFKIIDFEGEPARPLSERRAKALALRDVAGMIRSFQYAAYAALFARGSDLANPNAAVWADSWSALTSALYLGAYFEAADGRAFVPQGQKERRAILDVFLLHKGLYEVAYELNNRPDWVSIPLRGILGLVH